MVTRSAPAGEVVGAKTPESGVVHTGRFPPRTARCHDQGVDQVRLQTLATTLTELSEAMWAAPAWIRDGVGEPQVDDAIERFGQCWADGRIQVQENCHLVGDLAGRAAARMRSHGTES
jgi:hypothetical protein